MTPEPRTRKRTFRSIIGALAVVAVVSGGAAYAASRDNSPQARSQAIVNDAAGTLGVDPSRLSSALKQALENQVDAQVTAGTLSKEQGDAIKKRIEDGTQPIFGGPGFGGGPRGRFPGGGFGFRLGGPGLMGGIEDVATYLGLKPADLATQLRSGKSLADIAKAQGKTVDGLKTAITEGATKQLDAAVTAGKLEKEQETKLLAALSSHLDDLVNGTGKMGFGVRPAFGGGPHSHFPGRGFGFGFARPGLMGGIEDVASYLGLKPADLATQLRSGKSLADIAKAQGKTVDGLKTAITDAATKQLDAAVTAGKLEKEQETKLLAALSSHLDDLVNGTGKMGFGVRPAFGGGPHSHFPGRGFGFGFARPGLMGGIEDVASYLGLKPADLATQLRSGKSLADIAKAQGKTVDGLKTAITDAATKQLDAAVTAGKLEKEQETKLLAALSSHLDDLVNGTGKMGFGVRPAFGGGPHGHFPGRGFGFGFAGPGLMGGIEDVASYLGLKPADLATQLRSGKSLADIAKAQGKSVDGLKTAITDA